MPPRTLNDEDVELVNAAFEPYVHQYPNARFDAYRQNSASLRIRIIDPRFASLGLAERERDVWDLLRSLPDDVFTQITMLLLLSPDEADRSFANQDFENPLPSEL